MTRDEERGKGEVTLAAVGVGTTAKAGILRLVLGLAHKVLNGTWSGREELEDASRLTEMKAEQAIDEVRLLRGGGGSWGMVADCPWG